MSRQHHRSTLFPYTTLFRSNDAGLAGFDFASPLADGGASAAGSDGGHFECRVASIGEDEVVFDERARGDFAKVENGCRSEEHTSELQSHSDLVCRLLLEKKK